MRCESASGGRARPASAISLFQVVQKPAFRPSVRPRSARTSSGQHFQTISAEFLHVSTPGVRGKPSTVQKSLIAQNTIDLDGAEKYYERRAWLVRRGGDLRVEDLRTE